MKTRCLWATNQFDAYQEYHDIEWGVPVHEDRVHFEFLILEGAQAGLSWATILKRRPGYRAAFSDFEVHKVAQYSREKIERILQDPGVIRNKLKVNGAVTNAKLFLDLQTEFGSFDAYIWSFVNNTAICNTWKHAPDVPTTTPESDALSKDLKKRGFKFCGSTIMYAYMQACGLVNDHTTDCYRHKTL
ncbi:MAG: DNA-3-methyladenine glycosylase I [Salibacteraceae bacterium]|jgi:DNA-3-methyladenine glycosylase I